MAAQLKESNRVMGIAGWRMLNRQLLTVFKSWQAEVKAEKMAPGM